MIYFRYPPIYGGCQTAFEQLNDRIHFFRRYESYNAKMKRFNSIIITYELAEESEK